MARSGDRVLYQNAYTRRPEIDNTIFPRFKQRYIAGEIPAVLVKEGFDHSILWKVPLANVDYSYYLPIFFDGLMETEKPVDMIANLGLHQMLHEGGRHININIPHFINPLCRGLNSTNPDVLVKAIMALQHVYDVTGLSLYPYYDRILPILKELKQTASDVNGRLRAMYHPVRIREIVKMIDHTIQLLGHDFL